MVYAADAVVGPWLCQRFALCLTATSKLLVTSVVMYLHMVSRDCDRWDGEAKAQPSHLNVQEHLRVCRGGLLLVAQCSTTPRSSSA